VSGLRHEIKTSRTYRSASRVNDLTNTGRDGLLSCLRNNLFVRLVFHFRPRPLRLLPCITPLILLTGLFLSTRSHLFLIIADYFSPPSSLKLALLCLLFVPFECNTHLFWTQLALDRDDDAFSGCTEASTGLPSHLGEHLSTDGASNFVEVCLLMRR
jgi:hypothetical protein